MTNRANLLEALSRAAQVADRRAPMPILASALVQSSGDDSLLIAAQDLTVSVATSVDAKSAKPLSLAVNARQLLDRVRMMPDGEVTLSENGGTLTVKGESNRRYALQTTPAEEFPSLPSVTEPRSIALSGETLSLLLSRVYYAVSTDETRPHLACAMLECGQDTVTMVATDGHRLAHASVPYDGDYRGQLLIPLRAVEILRKAIEGDVELERSGSDLFLSFGDCAYSVRLTDATFVPYQAMLPNGSEHVASVDTAALTEALRAVSLATDRDTNGVILALKDGEIKVTAEHCEEGEAADTVSVESAHELKVKLNAIYLIEALSAATSERVEIAFKTELDPVTVRDAGYQCVIMPMRI